MQGVHAFDPKAKMSIDLESFVAADHFLRQIDRVLDLSFVRELTAACYADGKGRPSVDPEVFFRMQLVGYFNGIAKDRHLCEEVNYNLAYRWFCHLSLADDVPDHSSLTCIRDRLGEEIFESVFRKIVEQCQEKGLVKDECRVMTDATLIAANASLNSLVHNDPEIAKQEVEAQRHRRRTIDEKASRKLSNQTHRSRTDPDATLAQKKGTPLQLKYKVHQTIDAESRVILDTEVTTGARQDNQPYLEQIERVRDRYKLTIKEAITDRGYGSAEIIQSLKEKGIKPFVPLWNRNCGRNSGSAADSSTIEKTIAFAVLLVNTSFATRAITGIEHGTLLRQVSVVIAPWLRTVQPRAGRNHPTPDSYSGGRIRTCSTKCGPK